MNEIISTKEIITQIFQIRGAKVMLDFHLATLYEVETRVLKQQVRRNIDRFPEDFMFQLSQKEKEEVVANCDHLKTLKYSPNLPFAFTEYGAVMLASVLNSKRAVEVNIQIVRIFTGMREALFISKDVLLKLEQLEKKITVHDENIEMIFRTLRQLINPPQQQRKRIGFKPDEI